MHNRIENLARQKINDYYVSNLVEKVNRKIPGQNIANINNFCNFYLFFDRYIMLELRLNNLFSSIDIKILRKISDYCVKFI